MDLIFLSFWSFGLLVWFGCFFARAALRGTGGGCKVCVSFLVAFSSFHVHLYIPWVTGLGWGLAFIGIGIGIGRVLRELVYVLLDGVDVVC